MEIFSYRCCKIKKGGYVHYVFTLRECHMSIDGRYFLSTSLLIENGGEDFVIPTFFKILSFTEGFLQSQHLIFLMQSCTKQISTNNPKIPNATAIPIDTDVELSMMPFS